jgi:exonuclease VII large subunit
VLVRSVKQVQAGDQLQVQVSDGSFGVQVDERQAK